jgi:two-component system sensor histidine kinase UhpB
VQEGRTGPRPGLGVLAAWLRRLNETVPLFWKIQIANTALLAVAIAAAAALRPTDLALLPPLLLVLALGGAGLNSLIVRAALAPAERLRRELARVGEDLHHVPVAGDPMTRSIAVAVNDMVARLVESRRAAALAAFQAEQRERSRIAHDLHDDVSQRVAALVRNLERLSQAPTDEAARLAQEARTILELLRRTMAALHPLVLDDLGFDAALGWLAQEEAPNLEVHLTTAGVELDRLTASVLFRIAQEALANIRRHAGARTVWITARVEEGEYVLEIEDDGHGIPAERLQRPGYGLRSMRERAQGLGGSFEVWTRPGEGTAVRVAVPYPRRG